jgi:hypothetical protein
VSSKRSTAQDERRARLEQVQAEQKRAERKRARLISLIVTVAVLALVIPAALVILNEQRAQDELDQAAAQPVEGVQEFEIASAAHTADPVDYAQLPPVGGDHHPIWQNCGFYEDPVVDEHAVHSLEHGAVWVTYDPALETSEVERLRALADRYTFLLVSPYDGLPTPVIASAWGLQLQLDSVEDERLEPFIRRYIQGPQTPEPGAPCSGGIG